MTSLVHFEKLAEAIETPHLAAIDGRLQLRIAGKSFGNAWDACDITMPFGDFEQSGWPRPFAPRTL